jgi:hypothetical protein
MKKSTKMKNENMGLFITFIFNLQIIYMNIQIIEKIIYFYNLIKSYNDAN